MSNQKMNRRALIKGAGSAGLVAGGAFLLAACSPDGETEPTTEPAADNGPEAPMLADLVEAGELPPVDKRLPEDPLVVQPTDRIGTYGGTWNTAVLGPADTAWLSRTMGYEPLVRWQLDWTGAPGSDEIIPNVAASFDFEPNGSEYTFKLRPGMRWSDGTPFTVDDLSFAYDDILLNEELFPTPPSDFVIDGAPATLTKVDEETFTFRFENPSGLFLSRLASDTGGLLTGRPRHYLEQFHKAYNPDVEALAEEDGYDDWLTMFTAKSSPYDNPDLPVLLPWVMTAPIADATRATAERNPYYWKVDPEGSQLPYLDQVAYEVIQDAEVMLTKALNGEIDMHSRHFNTSTNKPVLAQNRESGGFGFFHTITAEMNTLVLMFNLTHQDPVKNELFNNLDFRVGLSHAINRQEIIDVAYQRQGEPFQCAPRPESPFYDEELAKQYTEYDVDLANQFLDQAGYDQRGNDNRRLGPDGNPIAISVEFATGIQPDWPDAINMIRDYWAKVGITLEVRPEDRSLLTERVASNEHDISVWLGGGGIDVILNPYWYAPLSSRSDYAQLWAEWYTSGGADGTEPPEGPKQQMELYDQLKATADADEQEALMREILAITREEFYTIGINLRPPGYGIVRNNFHNVPAEMPGAWLYPTPAPSNPEQYFEA